MNPSSAIKVNLPKLLSLFNLKCLLLLVSVFGAPQVPAQSELFSNPSTGFQQAPLKITLEVGDSDGILINQNSIQAFLTVENIGENESQLNTHWQIFTDRWQPLKMFQQSQLIGARETIRMDCPLYVFPGPGFYRISARVTIPGMPDQTLEHVIGIDPEQINAPLDKKEDFELFWQTALKDLSTVAPEYKIIAIPRRGSKTALFKVEMKSYLHNTVRGWLEVPRKKGVFPVLLRVPGYQENLEPIDVADDLIVFSFNTRDHGESDDSDGGRSWDMWVRGLEAKENYYYKGLFLDCIRALDFLETRADVDQDRIAIWGGSQGGGLSLSTAALDSRVDLCIADIPYMCDYPGYFEITYWKEVSSWFAQHPQITWDSVLNTLSYYDTKNLADKISCPVWMGIGLQDDICPPSTSFATFNRVKSVKRYTVYKKEGHRQPEEHYVNRFKQLRDFFRMDGN